MAALELSATFLILIVLGFGVRKLLAMLRCPAAVSLMALGAVLGPNALDVLPDSWLDHVPVLSKAAFVVLLLRAGLTLPLGQLKQVLGMSVVLGLLPVAVELGAVAGLARSFLFDEWSLCLLTGFLIAAVSPAVVLPTMLRHKDMGLGSERRVPDTIIGQTVFNAFVAQTGILLSLDWILSDDDVTSLMKDVGWLPCGISLGIACGVATGFLVARLSARATGGGNAYLRPRRWLRLSLVLTAGLAVYFGSGALSFESVFATLAVGAAFKRQQPQSTEALVADLRGVWSVAEIVLFVNLAARTDLGQLATPHWVLLLLAVIAIPLTLRLATSAMLLQWTRFVAAERAYITLSHVPKATVQAVFGAVPLLAFAAAGDVGHLEAGQTILTLAVVSVVATAPLGAWLLERTAVGQLSDRQADDAPGRPEDPPASQLDRGVSCSTTT